GRDPPPLDVLYWDNDSTRLPAALHHDFVDMYDRAVFEHHGRHRVLGVPVDYGKVCVDTYFTAGLDDYLMPWSAVYRSARVFRGRHRFVLSDSGHVQSLLRPPRLAKTLYYTNDEFPESAEEWLASARRHDGTWWGDWYAWLARNSGALKTAPRRLGTARHPPIADAPGEYAVQKL
ncbi:MAG TPA: class I poly(R)-hydroxyalkanoic acid synthase, partial [Woeseiaceae bacterium]|nr:class I poly(R)-hydroxyalkanoic acid synthase [Woeseiaceae bacterium]